MVEDCHEITKKSIQQCNADKQILLILQLLQYMCHILRSLYRFKW